MTRRNYPQYWHPFQFTQYNNKPRRVSNMCMVKNNTVSSNPFPLIKPPDTLLSGKILTVNKNIEYWSYVYDAGTSIYKQTTHNLALREANILRMLDSHYFPKVKKSWVKDNYSVVVLEKIKGENFSIFSNELMNNQSLLFDFVYDCLRILDELDRKGILHRDIRPDNILIRDNHPVLIDFGWAESGEEKIFTPADLGGIERSPNGKPSDIYSMGKVIEQVIPQMPLALKYFLGLMICPTQNLRVTDISLLISIWLSLKDSIKNHQNDKIAYNPSSGESTIILKLLEQINLRDESTNKLETIYIIYKWRLILFLKRIRKFLFPMGSYREKLVRRFFYK